MQRTLFLYIFKDLLKVFLLTSGALAGIMSFGGLLRPLTQRGLDLGQVGQMLAYFMPAMTNYSWPIAALFAATFVYGRLSSDNELTACRAAGLSYVHILLPAALLGTLVTLCSAFFLAWVVPHSFLKVEQVIYSNLAKLVAGEITRTQKLNLSTGAQSATIFALDAAIGEPDPAQPRRQLVQLNDVVIVKYAKTKDRRDPKIPLEFYTADTATAVIDMPEDADEEVMLTCLLSRGEKLPATVVGALPDGAAAPSQVRARIDSSTFGPIPYQSQVRESTKFMDVIRLLDVRAHPEKSRAIKRHMAELVRMDQQRLAQDELFALARSGQPIVCTDRNTGEVYTVQTAAVAGGERPRVRRESDDRVTLTAGTLESPGVAFGVSGSRQIAGRAREVVLTLSPDAASETIYTRIEARDATLNYEGQTLPVRGREWNVPVTMSEPVAAIDKRSANDFYFDAEQADRMRTFRVDYARQQNRIEAELNSRFGFAFSCFILSIVGATIGMMTRSGNFVTAFAVSVGPALCAIVLIVTGQHIAETQPHITARNVIESPLQLGLTVLWAGPLLVVALGSALYYKLSRT